jgi:hypothetical protein
LRPDGDGTVLVVEQSGLPLEHLAAFGAGNQIHAEDLAAYLSGREPTERTEAETEARWEALMPAYEQLAADVTKQTPA